MKKPKFTIEGSTTFGYSKKQTKIEPSLTPGPGTYDLGLVKAVVLGEKQN
jgi:hypothetical protein